MNDMHRETVSGMDPTPATLRCPEGLIPSSGRRAPEVAVVDAAPLALWSQMGLGAPARRSGGGLLGMVWRTVGSDVLPAIVAAARARRAW